MTLINPGVVYVAYGQKALQEARFSAESLTMVHREWPVVVISDHEVGWAPSIEWVDRGTPGRWAKVNLDVLSPFEGTLFLDADTRVYGDLRIGFNLLELGWDMVMVHSQPQGGALLGHLTDHERIVTLSQCSIDPLQLNTGVIWFQKSERVRRLFREWRVEWERFKDKDQGALLRALEKCKTSIALLGRPYNGGAVVGHRFGAARG